MRRGLTALQVVAIWAAGLGAAAQFGKISLAYDRFAAFYAGASPAEMGFLVSVVGIVGLAFGTTARRCRRSRPCCRPIRS